MLTVNLEESMEVDGTELSQSFESDGVGCYTIPTPGESNATCFDNNLSNDKINRTIGFDLSGVYPNPFNPTTTIEYDISENMYVSIDICNVKGQIIENLNKGFHTQGKYYIKWDASHFSSGIYLVRVNAGLLVDYQKLMLIK